MTLAQPVKGLDELNRAFALARDETQKSLPQLLKFVAEPVDRDAETLAAIHGAGVAWSQFRIGVVRTAVYVAPVPKGTRIVKRKRKNFASRLLNVAMIPALNKNRAVVEDGFDKLMARIERKFNRG